MKKHHTTVVLLILFFTGLIVLWWADWAGVKTPDELRRMSDRALPELIDLKPPDLRRLEIVRAKEKDRLVFARTDPGRWQMLEPVDAAADFSLVETLARNLQNLRKLPDPGLVDGPASAYGLDAPAATIRVFGADVKAPLATLEVGKAIDQLLYVRVPGAPGIEVVDARTLNMLDRPVSAWRDRSLVSIPSFLVESLQVTGPGRDLEARRVEGKKWLLERPVPALAAEEKVEGVVAELTSLKVVPGDQAFVADNVKDGAPYGLDAPAMTIALRDDARQIKPQTQTLLVGKPIPNQPDRFYARRGDQDDVVAIELKEKDLRELGTDPNAFRNQKVTDLDPARANFIRLEASGVEFELAKSPAGWQLLKPARMKADTPGVQAFLSELGGLQTFEFLDPLKVVEPRLEPPNFTIKVWQPGPDETATIEPGSGPKGEPKLNLRIGRYDPLRKIVYARVEGDRAILNVPETLVKVLPKNTLAFRDRTMLALSPGQLQRLTVVRRGTTYELVAPGASTAGPPTHWQLKRPVEAKADDEAATKMALILANLHAVELVSEQLGDVKAFGLHAPALTISWTTNAESGPGADKAKASSGTLRIGGKPPNTTDQVYANIEGSPIVFTLSAANVEPFESEFHDRRVLAFPPDKVKRLVLRWPGRALGFTREPRPAAPAQWAAGPDADIAGFDMNKLNALNSSLAGLRTPAFAQYEGPFPPSFGLDHPQLTIQVVLEGTGPVTSELRIGNALDKENFLATTSPGQAGPVFLLNNPAWTELVQTPKPPLEIPEDVFAPEK